MELGEILSALLPRTSTFVNKVNVNRLLAVPFKIVAKAREIAERKRKTGANERRELFSCFSPCSSLAALCALGSHALATIRKGTAGSLMSRTKITCFACALVCDTLLPPLILDAAT